MKKFVGYIFFVYLFLVSCAKPKCPTYMTPQEFARYESKRDQHRKTPKRDKNGHIKKRKVSVDKVR